MPPVALYGAGTLGRLIGSSFETGFVWIDDTPSKSGTLIDGHSVVSLEDFACEQDIDQALVYICIYQPGFSFLRLRDEIRRRHPHLAVRPFTDLLFGSASERLPYLFFELPSAVEEKLPKYARVAAKLSDELSRETLTGHLRLRMTGEFDAVVWTSRNDIPFIVDRLSPELTYFDVGAFDGDTVEDFIAISGGCFRHIVVIEPDAENLSRAKARLTESDYAAKITYRQVVISSSRGQLGFRADGNMGSQLDPLAIQTVPSLLLSDLKCDGNTYIKLDIEGSEISALREASSYLTVQKPLLAVSVYHRPDDLLDAVDILTSFPGYELYLRCHGESGEDLMLYAVPAG